MIWSFYHILYIWVTKHFKKSPITYSLVYKPCKILFWLCQHKLLHPKFKMTNFLWLFLNRSWIWNHIFCMEKHWTSGDVTIYIFTVSRNLLRNISHLKANTKHVFLISRFFSSKLSFSTAFSLQIQILCSMEINKHEQSLLLHSGFVLNKVKFKSD